jgi:hypothetical protein
MPSGTANLVVYPNPVTDALTVDLTGKTGDVTISILTLEGKLMHTQNATGNSLVIMHLRHLPKGIYLCRYTTAEEIKTVKIIKQ